MKLIKLVFSFGLILLSFSGCKKEETPDLLPPVVTPGKWERISVDRFYQNEFVENNEIYLLGLINNYKMDSAEIVDEIPSMNVPSAGQSYLYRSRYSGKYIAQVNLSRNSMMVYELLNPSIYTIIFFDSLTAFPGSLKTWGNFNDQNEFMISTKNSTVIKFSFTTSGNNLQYTTEGIAVDTATVYTTIINRILSTGSDFYISANSNKTYKYSNSMLTTVDGFRMWDIIETNDTLYAPIFWNAVGGYGLIASFDNGQNWQQVISGVQLDYYLFYVIDEKILMTFRGTIVQLKLDYYNNQMTSKILNADGLTEKFTSLNDEIVSLLHYNGKIYAATSRGLFVRKISELGLL